MKQVDYELCEACENNMREAGVFGLTTEQMIEQEAEIEFDFALILMKEGHTVKQKGEPYAVRLDIYESCGETKREFAYVDENDKVMSYLSFTTQQLLATNWTVIK